MSEICTLHPPKERPAGIVTSCNVEVKAPATAAGDVASRPSSAPCTTILGILGFAVAISSCSNGVSLHDYARRPACYVDTTFAIVGAHLTPTVTTIPLIHQSLRWLTAADATDTVPIMVPVAAAVDTRTKSFKVRVVDGIAGVVLPHLLQLVIDSGDVRRIPTIHQ